MKYLFFFLPILFSVIVVSCTSAPQPVSSTSVLNVSGAVEVEIWASNGCVKSGETVKLRATVSNKSTKTFAVTLINKPVLDIRVDFSRRTRRGEIRWSDSKPLTADVTHLELAPGESKTIEMGWVPDQSATVGVGAEFNYDNHGNRLGPSITVYVGSCPGLGP